MVLVVGDHLSLVTLQWNALFIFNKALDTLKRTHFVINVFISLVTNMVDYQSSFGNFMCQFFWCSWQDSAIMFSSPLWRTFLSTPNLGSSAFSSSITSVLKVHFKFCFKFICTSSDGHVQHTYSLYYVFSFRIRKLWSLVAHHKESCALCLLSV